MKNRALAVYYLLRGKQPETAASPAFCVPAAFNATFQQQKIPLAGIKDLIEVNEIKACKEAESVWQEYIAQPRYCLTFSRAKKNSLSLFMLMCVV